MKDIANQKFGFLTAMQKNGSSRYGVIWECLCVCGKRTMVVSAKLLSGQITSCGCSRQENLIGRKFGRYTVVSLVKRDGTTTWKCLCDCGKIKIVQHGHLKNGHTQSCGCYNKERIRATKMKNIAQQKFNKLTILKIDDKVCRKTPQVYWLCQCDCGKQCSLPAWSIVSGNTTSCGCVRKSQKKELHPRWNKNITAEERASNQRRFNSDEHKKWRLSVFQRDKYACQISGQKGGQLVAHHIISWNKNKQLRFDVKNGITMTRKLHILFHKKYGYGDNTQKQLTEFTNLL